jgi:hypothetical protein
MFAGSQRPWSIPVRGDYLPFRLFFPVCELPDVPPFLFDLAIVNSTSDYAP